MKYLLPLAFILFVTAGMDAQCTLTLKDAPAIRGLKFGMSGKDVIATIGQPLKSTLTSRNEWAYNPEMQQTEVRGLDGITLMTVHFEKDKLTNIDIDYNPQVQWKDAREFAKNISTNLNLPISGWTFSNLDESVANMKCREFALMIYSGLPGMGGQLHITDLAAKQAGLNEKKRTDGEWKGAFKP